MQIYCSDVTYTCVLTSVAIFFESDYSGNYKHALIWDFMAAVYYESRSRYLYGIDKPHKTCIYATYAKHKNLHMRFTTSRIRTYCI